MDLFDISGRRLLIAGAGGHVGRGLAEALIARGAAVAVCDLAPPGIPGARVSAAFDITDEASVAACAAQAAEALGGLDGLVNAAGLLPVARAEDLPAERFRACIEVNLTGAFLLAVAVRRHMGPGATQVHLASVSSTVANPGYAAYASSKAGLAHLVRVLAREWARDGITVNALAPSMLAQGMAAGYLGQARFRERALAEIPAGRFCTVADLVGPLLLLLAPAGGYITGQVLAVDGGRTLV